MVHAAQDITFLRCSNVSEGIVKSLGCNRLCAKGVGTLCFDGSAFKWLDEFPRVLAHNSNACQIYGIIFMHGIDKFEDDIMCYCAAFK